MSIKLIDFVNQLKALPSSAVLRPGLYDLGNMLGDKLLFNSGYGRTVKSTLAMFRHSSGIVVLEQEGRFR